MSTGPQPPALYKNATQPIFQLKGPQKRAYDASGSVVLAFVLVHEPSPPSSSGGEIDGETVLL